MRTAPLALVATLLLITTNPALPASPEELEARIAGLEAQLAELRDLAREMKALKEEEAERALRQEVLTEEVRTLREDIELPSEPEEKTSVHGMGPAASKVYRVEKGVSIGGYGQGWYTGFTRDEKPDDKDRFDLVRNVLYFGYRFSENLVLNTEIEWEHANSGGGSVSVEFAQLDYFFRDEVNLRAGLLLVPMGFVNEIHEPLYYLGNQRPEVERQIIPSTWRENGFGAFGKLGDRIEYRAYVMNGLRASKFSSSGVRGGRQKGSEALAEATTFVLRADYQASDELTLGAAVLTGNQGQNEELTVDAFGTKARPKADMTMVEAHAQYRKAGWQARVLGAWTRLSDADLLSQAQAVAGKGPVAERMRGAYGEVAYDLFTGKKWAGDKHLDVFFRYEAWDTQDRVPFGFARDASKDQQVRTWGLQYRPHPDVAFKLDFRNFGTAGGPRADEVNLGFGWVF